MEKHGNEKISKICKYLKHIKYYWDAFHVNSTIQERLVKRIKNKQTNHHYLSLKKIKEAIDFFEEINVGKKEFFQQMKISYASLCYLTATYPYITKISSIFLQKTFQKLQIQK